MAQDGAGDGGSSSYEAAGIGGKIKDLLEDEKRRIAEKVPPTPLQPLGPVVAPPPRRGFRLTRSLRAQGITGALAEHKT